MGKFLDAVSKLNPITSLVSSGLGVVGSIMSNNANKRNVDATNAANLQATQETNQANVDMNAATNQANRDISAANNAAMLKNTDMANAHNEAMYKLQHADAIADWQRQNEYNDPANQKARMLAAGLNPASINGDTAAASSISTPSAPYGEPAGVDPGAPMQSATLQAPHYDPYLQYSNPMHEALQAMVALSQVSQSDMTADSVYMDSQLKRATFKENVRAAMLANESIDKDIKQKKENTRGLKLANDLLSDTYGEKVLSARLANESTRAAIANIRADEALKHAQAGSIAVHDELARLGDDRAERQFQAQLKQFSQSLALQWYDAKTNRMNADTARKSMENQAEQFQRSMNQQIDKWADEKVLRDREIGVAEDKLQEDKRQFKKTMKHQTLLMINDMMKFGLNFAMNAQQFGMSQFNQH